ncbi:MAG: radical SAM protein [Clostridiales Family XIII bacterium]|jgi:nitrogen fixation protein NifB|nr:radical SAM protein [Clostridiales Family XIII bacterium]
MFKDKIFASHPCFAEGRPSNNGRIHLPVCPVCNISCNFCRRSLNAEEDRPGVASAILTPGEAAAAVRRAMALCPDITVAGVAGPGDTLASEHALDALELVGREFPGLIKCISTNGLMLPEKAERVLRVGVDALTVTVNAVDPAILSRICDGVVWGGSYIRGEAGAAILIANQLQGAALLAREGVALKINTVLVPGVNDAHIREIARAVSKAGAHMHNIIPLLPQHKMSRVPPPTCAQLDRARADAGEYVRVFRHCRHCRADAAGIPGVSEFGGAVYGDRVFEETFSHG